MAITLSKYEQKLFELADILRSASFGLREINPGISSECKNLLKRIAQPAKCGRLPRGDSLTSSSPR
jgi:hypothetical protein